MSKIIHILNGPNLNLLGEREPQIYGRTTLQDIEAECRETAATKGFEIVFRQTNSEAEMIGFVQAARKEAGIVINPAAFSYHSVGVLDALKACECPIIEVHISNIHRRDEQWRKDTIMTAAATGVISGLGVDGYRLAVLHLVRSR